VPRCLRIVMSELYDQCVRLVGSTAIAAAMVALAAFS